MQFVSDSVLVCLNASYSGNASSSFAVAPGGLRSLIKHRAPELRPFSQRKVKKHAITSLWDGGSRRWRLMPSREFPLLIIDSVRHDNNIMYSIMYDASATQTSVPSRREHNNISDDFTKKKWNTVPTPKAYFPIKKRTNSIEGNTITFDIYFTKKTQPVPRYGGGRTPPRGSIPLREPHPCAHKQQQPNIASQKVAIPLTNAMISKICEGAFSALTIWKCNNPSKIYSNTKTQG